MKRFLKFLPVIVIVAFAVSAFAATSTTRYIVTNDDNFNGNSATVYTIGQSGALTQAASIPTGGFGLGGGYFANARVTVVHTPNQACAFVSDGAGNTVDGIDLSTLTLSGSFAGGAGDTGDLYGTGLALNAAKGVLYAAYTGSNTLGVFSLGPKCSLKYKTSVSNVVGLNFGATDGMKVHGNILVAGYSDGSMSSFNVSSGVPVPNNDGIFGACYNSFGDLSGGGADISKDGHWALFGTASFSTDVDVVDISSGKLGSDTCYSGLTAGSNSNNVLLSPDESLLYIANNSGGTISAAPFNKSTGVLSSGCLSPALKNFGFTWFYTAGIVNASIYGNGIYTFVAEWGSPSSIGVVKTGAGSPCTLTESPASPANDSNSPGLLSIGIHPPRTF